MSSALAAIGVMATVIAATRSGRDRVRIGGVSFSRFFCVLDMRRGRR